MIEGTKVGGIVDDAAIEVVKLLSAHIGLVLGHAEGCEFVLSLPQKVCHADGHFRPCRIERVVERDDAVRSQRTERQHAVSAHMMQHMSAINAEKTRMADLAD